MVEQITQEMIRNHDFPINMLRMEYRQASEEERVQMLEGYRNKRTALEEELKRCGNMNKEGAYDAFTTYQNMILLDLYSLYHSKENMDESIGMDTYLLLEYERVRFLEISLAGIKQCP